MSAARSQLGGLAMRRLELRDHIGAINEAQWKWLLKQRLKHKLGSMADLVRVYRARQPATIGNGASMTMPTGARNRWRPNWVQAVGVGVAAVVCGERFRSVGSVTVPPCGGVTLSYQIVLHSSV